MLAAKSISDTQMVSQLPGGLQCGNYRAEILVTCTAAEHLLESEKQTGNTAIFTDSLDGFNTLHDIGTITVMAPGTRRNDANTKDTYNTWRCSSSWKDRHTLLQPFYNQIRQDFESLEYTQLHDFHCKDPHPTEDTLWKIFWLLRSPRPVWSGFMQPVSRGQQPGQSSVHFLLIIDLIPSLCFVRCFRPAKLHAIHHCL